MATTPPEYPDRPAATCGGGNDPHHPVVESTNEARAGTTGHGVRYVLLFGTAGIVIAFAVIYATFFAGA